MPTTDVHGRQLFYVREGEGEPLLLVQGLSGTHLAWGDPFAGELRRHHDTIAYDHRGVGHSERADEPFTIADLADDAAGLLDALGIESAHVMGISMGGMVAQELALRHRERVRTLTLGCTYCGGPQGRLTDEAVIGVLAEATLSGDRERSLRAAWEANVSGPFAAEQVNFEVFREMAGALPVPVPMLLQQLQAIQGHDTSARLASLRVPTLVLHGTADRMLDVANGELIASLIPDARLERFDGVGHMFWWEQPERSAALVREHTARAPAAELPGASQ
jgi:3-oxoadipate enol-lactonase